ncbi:methyltransferase family protein [Tsuneonella sp. HG222]
MSRNPLIDYGERLFLILLSAPFLYRFATYVPTHPYALALVCSELLAVILILIRKPGEMAASPFQTLIAFAGTALPLFATPGDTAFLPVWLSSVLMVSGLLINISAKLALNRSYGLIAANRGIKRGGPYRLVRHPMYLGYFVTQISFLLSAFSYQLLALYALAWIFQILRIFSEEALLMEDPAYREFAKQVPRRILPGF